MIFDDLPSQLAEAPVERIAPLEILYEFDGPRIFSLSGRDGNLLLAYLCDETDSQLNLLLVPSSPGSIERLKSGQLSVRAALNQAWVWIISCDRQWKILGAKSASFDELPDAVLPQEGTPLLPEHIPLLVTKQIGPFLTPRRIPISVVRRAVDGASGAIKSLLEGTGFVGGIGRPDERYRKLYDLPVQRIAFGSLEVSFALPAEDVLKGFRSGDGLTIDQIAQAFQGGLKWLAADKDTIEATPQNRAILCALDSLSPPIHGDVTEVELSGLLLGSDNPRARLTKESTRKIRRVLAQIPANLDPVVRVGYVREFDKDRGTFTLRDALGTDVERFELSEDLFDDALDAFDEDFEVKVIGFRSTTQRFAKALSITRATPPPA
jgi:uncharacterized protein DUF6575